MSMRRQLAQQQCAELPMEMNHWFYAEVSYIGYGSIGWQRQISTTKKKSARMKHHMQKSPTNQSIVRNLKVAVEKQSLNHKKKCLSIQQQIEEALGRIILTMYYPSVLLNSPVPSNDDMDEDFSQPIVKIHGSSRTDAGTHALSQRTTFRLDIIPPCLETLRQEVNAILPKTIKVQCIKKINELEIKTYRRTFAKKYVYYIEQADQPTLDGGLGPYCWYTKARFDLDRLKKALNLVVGTHDFRHLTVGMKSNMTKFTVRSIWSIDVILRKNVHFSLDLKKAGIGEIINYELGSALPGRYIICIEFIGDGFLRHMIRRIIGSIRPIAEGISPIQTIFDILKGDHPSGPSAPSRGLWLTKVWNSEEDFFSSFCQI